MKENEILKFQDYLKSSSRDTLKSFQDNIAETKFDDDIEQQKTVVVDVEVNNSTCIDMKETDLENTNDDDDDVLTKINPLTVPKQNHYHEVDTNFRKSKSLNYELCESSSFQSFR